MTSSRETRVAASAPARGLGWPAGLPVYAGAQAATFGLTWLAKWKSGQDRRVSGGSPVGGADEKAAYSALRQPVFAPPGWAFGPVWTLNNALQLWGLLHVLNLPPRRPDAPRSCGCRRRSGRSPSPACRRPRPAPAAPRSRCGTARRCSPWPPSGHGCSSLPRRRPQSRFGTVTSCWMSGRSPIRRQGGRREPRRRSGQVSPTAPARPREASRRALL